MHKVVLSACSPFFRQILQKTKQNHPFVYMKGIRFEDLQTIIDFIYNGEANVATKDVDRFLKAAKELKIKGLASEASVEDDKHNEPVEPIQEETILLKKEKKKRTKSKENVVVKQEEVIEEEPANLGVTSSEPAAPNRIQDIKINMDDTKLQELEEEIGKNLETCDNSSGAKVWKCNFCSKEITRMDRASDHVEAHLNKFNFPCEHCNKIMKNRAGLRSHIIYNHTSKINAFTFLLS